MGIFEFFLVKIDNSRAPLSTPILEMPSFNTFISFVRKKKRTLDISKREDPPTLDASYTVGNHNYRRYVTLSLLLCACDAIWCFLDSVLGVFSLAVKGTYSSSKTEDVGRETNHHNHPQKLQ